MALPSWSNTLFRGHLLQKVLEGGLEPSSETSGYPGVMKAPETIKVTWRNPGPGVG